MRKITKRSAAIIAASVIVVGGGAAAWAAAVNGWSVSGHGTGQADAATIVEMKATADMGSTKVYPGLVTTVTTKVTNPNSFPVLLNQTAVIPTAVTVTGPSTAADCKDKLTLAPNTLSASFPSWNPKIAANAVNQPVTADVTILDTLPLSCAGTHITVDYTFTGTSTV
jgi:hypothetical protein